MWGGVVMQYNLQLNKKQQIWNMSAPIAKKTVNNYSYHLTDTIGDGFSSQVYKGLDQKSKQSVAIKVVSKLNHNAKEQIELAKTEIRTLGILKGKNNILQLKEALQTKNSMYIITELCSKGTLRDELTAQRKMKEERAIKVVTQVINGYKSIHQEGLIHRDIKPDNLFLTADDELKIGDFGFAIDADKCQQALRENLGSPLFMSPQALTRNVYSFKSDIWAIGVTFYEMLVGKVPWRSKTEKELMQELQSFNIQIILPKGLSEVCERFLRRTLVKDVDLRMGPQQMFEFDFQQQRQKSSASTTTSILKKRVSLDVIFQSSLTKIGQKSTSRLFIKQSDTGGKTMKKGEESESTDENSKQNLQKIGEIDAETPIITKMTNSLTLQQTTALPEKGKNKLNRKYSEIKEKDQLSKFSQLQEEIPIMRNRSETVSQAKLTKKMQKQILLQIQSQINYFRFVFKVFKKTNQILKTSDQHIHRLKHNLLFFSHAKIQEIKILKYLNFANDVKTIFKASQQYANVVDVLNQYSQRYKKQQQKTGISPQCEGEKEFIEKLTYTLKVLHQNILKIQKNVEEFQRKKNLVFIVQDLLELSKLYVIQREHNWSTFHRQSSIFKTLQTTSIEIDLFSHWEKIKSELKKFINI